MCVGTYLKLMAAAVGEQYEDGQQQRGEEVSRVTQWRHEGDGAHLPIMTESGGAEQQPAVERGQVTKW